MKLEKRLLNAALLFCTVMLLTISAWAQQTVRGTLRAPSGEPLVGATVTVKGTNRSVVTDANGQFSIDAPPGSTLVVSSVGLQQREIAVTGTDINETLQATDAVMNEVVVIGYQSVRRRDLTGATGVINTQNTERVVARSVPEA